MQFEVIRHTPALFIALVNEARAAEKRAAGLIWGVDDPKVFLAVSMRREKAYQKLRECLQSVQWGRCGNCFVDTISFFPSSSYETRLFIQGRLVVTMNEKGYVSVVDSVSAEKHRMLKLQGQRIRAAAYRIQRKAFIRDFLQGNLKGWTYSPGDKGGTLRRSESIQSISAKTITAAQEVREDFYYDLQDRLQGHR